MESAIRKKREEAETYLVERGLSAKSLPRAIAIHEALGLCMLAVTWRLAYIFPPSNIPFLKQPLARIANAVPQRLSFLSSKGGASYIEASCMRKLVRPLTIPGKLYATFLIMSNFEESTADMMGKDVKTTFLPKAAFLQPLPALHSLI